MLRALLLVFGLVHASPFVHVRDPFGVRHRIKRAAVDLIQREARWALAMVRRSDARGPRSPDRWRGGRIRRRKRLEKPGNDDVTPRLLIWRFQHGGQEES